MGYGAVPRRQRCVVEPDRKCTSFSIYVDNVSIFDQGNRTAEGGFWADMANAKDRFGNPYVAASRGFIDNVIMPHSTRKRIIRALRTLKTKQLSNPTKKHDNLPL